MNALTNEQLNRKIAENCGLTIGSTGYDQHSRKMLNYCSDLNACAEFEKTLGHKGACYRDFLYEIVDRDLQLPGEHPLWAIHATARQRCEAFVAVMEGTK